MHDVQFILFVRVCGYVIGLLVFSVTISVKTKTCKNVVYSLRGIEPWDYFANIYIISGNWTSDSRKQQWAEEISKVELQDRIKVWQASHDLHNGHRGAWKSHYSLITSPGIQESECVVVFEDDVRFSDKFIANRKFYLRKILKFLSKTSNWEIFFLGSNIESMQIVPGEDNFVRVHAWALLAYIFSFEGTKLYKNKTFPHDARGGTIDGISYDSFNTYSFYPSLSFHPSNLYSDTTRSTRHAHLTENWAFRERYLHQFASTKCRPHVARMVNFGQVDFRWEFDKDNWPKPDIMCY